MKTTKLISLMGLLIILLVISCKDDDGQPNLKTSGPLYLRFEIDGEEKEYSSNQGYWGGGLISNGADTYGTLSGFTDGDLTFEFSKTKITISDLLNLKGERMMFGGDGEVRGVFSMTEDGIDASSNRIDTHISTSIINVIEVSEETSVFYPIGKLARITGTFQCQIKDVSGSNIYEITNGEFSLLFPDLNQ